MKAYDCAECCSMIRLPGGVYVPMYRSLAPHVFILATCPLANVGTSDGSSRGKMVSHKDVVQAQVTVPFAYLRQDTVYCISA